MVTERGLNGGFWKHVYFFILFFGELISDTSVTESVVLCRVCECNGTIQSAVISPMKERDANVKWHLPLNLI